MAKDNRRSRASVADGAAPSQIDASHPRSDVPIFASGNARDDEPEPRDWLAAIINGSEDAIISKDLNGTIQTWNEGATRLFGYSPEEVVGKSITILIPEDRLGEEPEIISRIQKGMRVEHFETRRRRKDGSMVDISLSISPIRNAKGVIVGASKIARNISDKRIAEEQQQLLMGEMRHRVKNLFALARAIVSISARSSASAEDVIQTVQERLDSLARAHELTWADPLNEPESSPTISLVSLSAMILEPYQARKRIKFKGDDMAVGGNAVTGIALLVHELATNSAKYGSLSVAEGQLDVCIRRDAEELHVVWEETGGPKPSPHTDRGFGSRLEQGLASALGAEIVRDWRPSGLVVSIRMSVARLAS